jgi:hypothetical protein
VLNLRVCRWKSPWWSRKQVANSGSYSNQREANIETKLEPGSFTVIVLRVLTAMSWTRAAVSVVPCIIYIICMVQAHPHRLTLITCLQLIPTTFDAGEEGKFVLSCFHKVNPPNPDASIFTIPHSLIA